MREQTKHLSEDLVIQTSFGDSGHTTFFVSSEEEFQKYQKEIISEKEVKVMKKVRCRGSVIEACATRHGTIVGPSMTELVGFKELTPYKGGWCRNEVFSPKTRKLAREKTFQVGEELRKIGYRGYFELDFLSDLDTEELYLGEINPRVTGANSMTNLAAFAHADDPLFLFHLLEYSQAEFELDVTEINERWSNEETIDPWSQMVIKHVSEEVDIITEAPPSGIWELQQDNTISFLRVQTHRRTVEHESRAFFYGLHALEIIAMKGQTSEF